MVLGEKKAFLNERVPLNERKTLKFHRSLRGEGGVSYITDDDSQGQVRIVLFDICDETLITGRMSIFTIKIILTITIFRPDFSTECC